MSGEQPPEQASDRPPASEAGASILDAAAEAFRSGPAVPRPTPPPAHAGRPERVRPLRSASPDDRRGAVRLLLETGARPDEVPELTRAMVVDPDAEVRASAAEALVVAGQPVDATAVRRALEDPQDRVRAAAVVLAERGDPGVAGTAALAATDRRWPLAQRAALPRAGVLIARSDPHWGDVFLERIGAMDPAPLPQERDGLAAGARSLGPDRLAAGLAGFGAARLGAARLLAVEGSPESLRLLAGAADQPGAGSGELAELVADALRALHGPEARPSSSPTSAAEADLDLEVVGGLARALDDPDRSVRDRARGSLEAAAEIVTTWAQTTLASGPAEAAARAASVAGALGLRSCAEAVLQRAAAEPEGGRAPYLRALAAIADPVELAALVRAVEPATRPAAVRIAWLAGGARFVAGLPRILEDSSGSVRTAALQVLVESGDPTWPAATLEALGADASVAVRTTALEALAGAEAPIRARALARSLADPEPVLRARGVQLLGGADDPEAVELLARGLRDEDEAVWRAAAASLASAGDRDRPGLWSVLRDSPADRRRALIAALEAAGGRRLVDLALDNARRPDPADRALALELAARSGGAEAAPVVLAALSDPDPGVRRAAASATASMGSPAAVEALARTLSDPQVDVRVEAVRALGAIDDDTVLDALIGALKDPEVRVRDMATEALARWHSPAVARRLTEALAAPDLRRPAGEALQRIGRSAIPALVEVATGPDAEAAAAAGTLLERIAGVEPFAAGLGDIDPAERLRAAVVLGVIGGSNALEPLVRALADPDVAVRAHAARALGSIGDPRAVRALRRAFLTDPVAEVAEAAEVSLRSLGAADQP